MDAARPEPLGLGVLDDGHGGRLGTRSARRPILALSLPGVALSLLGTAVVAAHVATGTRADVFADLADVDVGDTVEVFEDGRSVTYRVTRASAIDKKKVTTDQTVWGANTSRTRLAIITCDDAYGLRGDGHRVANFVVIADKV